MFEMSKRKLLIILGLLLLTFNPTGYSYFDYALIHPWAMDTVSTVVAITLGLLIGIFIFLLSLAWKSTEVLGKLIYLIPVVGVGFIMFIEGVLSNQYYLYMFTVTSLYLFILWGMIYPRLKLSMFKARNIDDLDSE